MNKSAILDDVLKPKSDFVEFADELSKHIVLLALLSFGWLSTTFGLIRPLYPALSVSQNSLILLTMYIAYVFAVRHWLGTWLFLAMAYNIPFFAIYMCFWITALLVGDVLGFVIGWDENFRWDRLLTNSVLTTLTSFVFVYLISDSARKKLGRVPEMVPIWLPSSDQSDPQIVMLKNANIIRREGRGVVVDTNDGEHTLKSTLAEVLAQVDPKQGLRVHRSYWVAHSFAERVVYVDGNPKLVCRDNRAIPINRDAARILK